MRNNSVGRRVCEYYSNGEKNFTKIVPGRNLRNSNHDDMSCKVIFGLFIYGIYFCSANPVQMGDDKSNWEAVWNGMKDSSVDSRSDDMNIFDRIVRINAEQRGSGIRRSDDQVFLFEGDIEMNRDDVVNMVQNDGKSRQTRAAIKNNGRNLWLPNIPYAISSSLSGESNTIKKAINEFEQTLDCLGSWQDVTSTSKPSDYLNFFQGQGCYSFVGKRGGSQDISIGRGCEYHGIVVHEIGHALGLFHEQSRPDRDTYVEIVWDNIIPSAINNFRKLSSSLVESFGSAYDYDSVMHYGALAFTRNGNATIISKQPNVTLGQRNGLSDEDKEQLRRLYGCTTANLSTVTPTMRSTLMSTVKSIMTSTMTSTVKSTVKLTVKSTVTSTVTSTAKSTVKPTAKTTVMPTVNSTVKPTVNSTVKPTVNGCQGNVIPDRRCNRWKRRGFCQGRYANYMRRNCCEACGTAATCTDRNTSVNCSKWARYGFCSRSSRFYSYMKRNCAKSCGCI